MRFRNQLLLGLGALVALIAGAAVTGIFALHVTSGGEGDLAHEYAEDVVLVQRLHFESEKLVATSRGYLLSGERTSRAQFEEAKRALSDTTAELEARPIPISGQPLLALAVVAADDYARAATRAVEERALMPAPESILPYYDRVLAPRRAVLESSVSALSSGRRESFEHALQDEEVLAERAEIALVSVAILAIGCGLALAFVVSRRLTRQFHEVLLATSAANRAAQAREELLAVVSHDLRNPLQAIAMGATLVADTTHEDATRRHIATVGNAAHRMQHLIEELVATSRIDNNQLELNCEPITAHELIEVTADLFRARANARHVELVCDANGDRVIADRERIVEVLSNLLGNAFKFTPEGGHIAVRAAPEGDAVRFAVADDGSGIAPDKLPHVFDRYYQAEHGKARQGLGLGLYICKRLVEAHHGAIGVDSQPGKGTTFWFTLPRAT